MDIEVLNTLHKILRNTSVTYCDLQRPDLSVRMRLTACPPVCIEDERPAAPAAAGGPVDEKPDLGLIRSEDVGIFHSAKLAVKPGDEVKPGQVVGTIESMGISHNVVSPVAGRISTQKVRNKEPVEYGEVIFEVEKT